MKELRDVILVLATVLLSTAVLACDTPEKTLTEFIQRDLKGERLSSQVSEKIDKLQVDNQFESAWDASVVVTGYHIKSLKTSGDVAVASVFFENSWTTSAKFEMSSVIDERVDIHLKKTKDCWKIAPPFTMPRIFPLVLLRYLEELVKEDKTTLVEKRILVEHETELKALREYISYIESKIKEKK